MSRWVGGSGSADYLLTCSLRRREERKRYKIVEFWIFCLHLLFRIELERPTLSCARLNRLSGKRWLPGGGGGGFQQERGSNLVSRRRDYSSVLYCMLYLPLLVVVVVAL